MPGAVAASEPRYTFHTVDVFTDEVFGGNPLAVIPRAEGLDREQMQRIAREFNLSETVFMLPPQSAGHTRRLRIFTPSAELPFAGHPTLGAAHVLAATGEIALTGDVTPIVFEEGIGPVAVTVRARHGHPHSAQLTVAQRPEPGPGPPGAAALATMLGLTRDEIGDEDLAPGAFSCGVPFLFVPVRDRGVLAKARLDRAQWSATLASFWAPQVYLVTRHGLSGGVDLRARMFAPALGVDEDPATGAAAAALGGYLAAALARGEATLSWVVEQGVEMGRRSRLEVEADVHDRVATAVRVAGASVMVSEGTLRVPAA